MNGHTGVRAGLALGQRTTAEVRGNSSSVWSSHRIANARIGIFRNTDARKASARIVWVWV